MDTSPTQANPPAKPAPNNAVAKPAAGGRALSIFGAALASSDFLLGLGCVGMAMIIMAILNPD